MNKKVSKLAKENRKPAFRFSANRLFSANRFGPLAFLLVFAVAGAAFVYSSSAAPSRKGTTDSQAIMYLTPNRQRLGSNDSLIANIWVNSYNKPVNAVQAVLNYPADKLMYVSVDANSSQFTIQAEISNNQGRLVIARGATQPLTGDQLVGTVVFKPVTNASGRANIGFDSSSQLLNSDTNQNILSQRSGGTYTIE